MKTATNELSQFQFQEELRLVNYVETIKVADGVICDVYEFADDKTKDLAVVRVEPRHNTPLQLVVGGDETIEIYGEGEGCLLVIGNNGKNNKYCYKIGDKSSGIVVKKGEKMQWQAADSMGLIFYEICTPPYEDGRFKNLT